MFKARLTRTGGGSTRRVGAGLGRAANPCVLIFPLEGDRQILLVVNSCLARLQVALGTFMVVLQVGPQTAGTIDLIPARDAVVEDLVPRP